MPIGVFADKLLDLCYKSAEKIAEQWYKSVSTSPRTPTYHTLPREALVSQASLFYKSLKEMYFAEHVYDDVVRFLEKKKYVEGTIAQGIPLAEIVYALIMMRRHIWLYAETQYIFFDKPHDIYQQTESINRTLLVFDYIIYAVVLEHERLAGQSTPSR